MSFFDDNFDLAPDDWYDNSPRTNAMAIKRRAIRADRRKPMTEVQRNEERFKRFEEQMERSCKEMREARIARAKYLLDNPHMETRSERDERDFYGWSLKELAEE